ncbi:hypothetical protein JQ615_36365 [Bradyrhizobium jicamae]|uniref:Uncharacterized protein n=1 Tax=Bradyrhizobium jicamae TaxID=280332 RepID=A0ABS5FX75_9BRAD|nr:hypothetical protein [Bradyrhizobium jicamae]MBR0800851.1 hypothetical protein [Bradyrhizobium jicamae]
MPQQFYDARVDGGHEIGISNNPMPAPTVRIETPQAFKFAQIQFEQNASEFPETRQSTEYALAFWRHHYKFSGVARAQAQFALNMLSLQNQLTETSQALARNEVGDPLSVDIKEATGGAMFATEVAANELLHVAPTRMAGVLALLKHATEFDTDGMAFPDALYDEERDISRRWQFFLIEHVAGALAEIQAKLV